MIPALLTTMFIFPNFSIVFLKPSSKKINKCCGFYINCNLLCLHNINYWQEYLPSNSVLLVTSHFMNNNLLEDDLYLISNSLTALFPVSSQISNSETLKKKINSKKSLV